MTGFGGMVAFEVKGGAEAAERFMSKLTVPVVAVSLGGAESLIIRPAAAVIAPMAAIVTRIPTAKRREIAKALLAVMRPCLSMKPTISGMLAK